MFPDAVTAFCVPGDVLISCTSYPVVKLLLSFAKIINLMKYTWGQLELVSYMY